MSGKDVVAYLGNLAGTLKTEKQRLEQERKAHPQRQGEVSGEEETAWANLLSVLLPSQAPEILDRASARLGLPSLGAAATAAARESRRRQLEAQIAECLADPEYPRREEVKNEIAIRLPGFKEMAAPLRADVRMLEDERFWHDLFSSGYGTSAYTARWYQRAYYRHWREGDRLLEIYGVAMNVTDFGALRAKYLSEKEALGSLEAEIAKWEDRGRRIVALEAKHQAATTGLAKLDDWVLDRARTLVRDHLAALTLADLTPLLGPDPVLQLAVKRAHGAKAKSSYLDSIQQEWVEKPLEDVNRRLAKVAQGMEKFSRPKHYYASFPRAEIEAKYGLPMDKWRQRWDRYQTTTQEIIVFHDYGRVDPLTQFLWWDTMVHSHHGNFIPDVCDHHRYHSSHHESYAHTPENDDLQTRDAS